MKTAVSLPDALFHQADRLASRLGVSRSDLYARALREYLARHSPDEVTEAYDRVVAAEPEGLSEDPFLHLAARETLERSEW